MCFGPSAAAKQASAEQRVEADDIEQEEVLLRSPHFCKKVYHYLMRPESVK